jgi:hypothetical protein
MSATLLDAIVFAGGTRRHAAVPGSNCPFTSEITEFTENRELRTPADMFREKGNAPRLALAG